MNTSTPAGLGARPPVEVEVPTSAMEAMGGVGAGASGAAAGAKRAEPPVVAELELEDGTQIRGVSFGAKRSVSGEVVFNTGMVGYPEALTDPSYRGQILVCTFPLIGNYGVPPNERDECGLTVGSGQPAAPGSGILKHFESDHVHIAGLIVADYSREYSHWNATRSLSDWLNAEGVPALTGIDTRSLTKRLREKGTMRGVIRFGLDRPAFHDPNLDNLAAQVCTREPRLYGKGTRRVVLVDCGAKNNIIRSLLARDCQVLRVPWDYPFADEKCDGVLMSNGPGNPVMYEAPIAQVGRAMEKGTPVFGICLGHQLMALAVGASTYKLKYGHRGQNQPVIEVGTDRCSVTTQNHSFAVDEATLPGDWRPWFTNLNDSTNEGMRHDSGRFFSVQFHPEACPGPGDTQGLFDRFREVIG